LYTVDTVTKTEQKMSASTLERYTRLLILAEAARAVSDFEDYRILKDQATQLRLTEKTI
jgi:hypothetical protein